MAVRFILGRAGAGKSSYCVESLRAELVRQPYGGSKLILLVPEQASLQAERELINTPELAGAQRGEVLSFKRFAQRLLQANPAQSHKILSPVGRTMVLQRLVGEHRPNLQYFRTDRLLPGLYKQLSLQIEEFMAAAVEPDELGSDDDADVSAETLTAKLADLRVLYSAYLRFLRGGYVDPAMTLEQARKTLPTARWIQGAHIWVDGFASFSVQESEFLIELAIHTEGMEITLLVDPQADGIANERAPDSYSLFWPTMQTYGKLLEALARRGVQIDHPLCLPYVCIVGHDAGTRAKNYTDGPLDPRSAHLGRRLRQLFGSRIRVSDRAGNPYRGDGDHAAG